MCLTLTDKNTTEEVNKLTSSCLMTLYTSQVCSRSKWPRLTSTIWACHTQHRKYMVVKGHVGNCSYMQCVHCRFLTGPPDLEDEKSMGKLPRVFVSTETDNEECYLLVYRAMSATICMLINGALHPLRCVFVFEVGHRYSQLCPLGYIYIYIIWSFIYNPKST